MTITSRQVTRQIPGQRDARCCSANEIASRNSLVHGLPASVSAKSAHRMAELVVRAAGDDKVFHEAQILEGPGFIAIDAATKESDDAIDGYLERFARERL